MAQVTPQFGRLGVLAGTVALSLLCGRSAVAEESVAANVIEFVTQTRNNEGVVRCGLFKESGWLKDVVQPSIVKITNKTARCIFKEIPPGVYGISSFHDEDNNGKLNTNPVGYPLEDYACSNNARNMFSAPSWSDAKFKYRGGAVKLRGVMK